MPRVAMFVLNSCVHDSRVRRAAATLGAAGFDTRVYATDGLDAPAGVEQLAEFSIVRIPLWRTSFKPGAAERLSFWWRAGRAAAAWLPDVVHAHDANTLPVAGWVARRHRRPLVYDSHELWTQRNAPPSAVWDRVDAVVERYLAPRSAAVIVVSEAIGDRLAALYSIPDSSIHLVRNMPGLRQTHDAVPDVRARTGLDSDRQILLYTGRITNGRGLDTAVQALPLLPDTVDLVMMGPPAPGMLERLQQLAADVGVSKQVHHVPPVPAADVAAVAAGGDAALVAIEPLCESYRLALPTKLFEAVQAGLPIVASALPAVAALVDDHDLGAVFEVGDVSGMASAITRALTHAAPGKHTRKALSWEQEHAALLDVYGPFG